MSSDLSNLDPGKANPAVVRLDLDQKSADPGGIRRGSMGHILDIGRRLKAGHPIDDEGRRLYEQAEATMQKAFKSMQSAFASIGEQLRPVMAAALDRLPEIGRQFDGWRREFAKQWAPVARQMADAAREMPPRIRDTLLALGERGWYLDGELGISELWDIEGWLSSGEAGGLDGFLVTHYESRLSEIEDDLVNAAPTREKILRSAFAAHRRGEYELSVPVLLTQADGICVDLTRRHLFIKDQGVPEVARWVAETSLDAFTNAVLRPLTQSLPIASSEKERERRMRAAGLENWVELNRHLVLHGESVDYGTQANSLKAISLINYLVGFVSRERDS